MAALRPPRTFQHEAFRDYAQGPLAFVPACVLLLVIRALGELGGWGSHQVLALSGGMSASVLVTAGFVQGMSRRASICLAFDDLVSAMTFLRGALVLAGICVCVVAAVVVQIGGALGMFAPQDVLTFGLAFLGLSTIWLLAAGLSLLRASAWLGAGLLGGLVSGLAVDRALALAGLPEWHLGAGTLAGFVSTIGVIAWAARRAFRRSPFRNRRRVSLPPPAYLIWEASPYFTYGALYALLLFIPHALGWLAVLVGEQPRLWAVASLEAGLSFSLPPLILAGGVAEHALQQFWKHAAAAQIAVPGREPDEFRRLLKAFYARQFGRYLLVLAALSVLAFGLFCGAAYTGRAATWLGFADLDLVLKVFGAALVAYWLIGAALFSCMFALSLACPRFALHALAPGLLTVLVIGVPLSLWGGAAWVPVTAVVASAASAAASWRTTEQMFRAVDYYYARAFS